MVTAQSIAAEAGGAILRQGGNAIDAAIATSFVACCIEPCNATLGGGGAALVYDAETRKGYGRASSTWAIPSGLTVPTPAQAIAL